MTKHFKKHFNSTVKSEDPLKISKNPAAGLIWPRLKLKLGLKYMYYNAHCTFVGMYILDF
jgi:hypothetical protein